jgi:zinc transporter
VQTETRPRADPLDDGLIVNLRAVNLNPGAAPADMVSLRLWVTQSLIISVRHRKVFAVDALRQEADRGQLPNNSGRFLAALTEGVTDRIEAHSGDVDDAVAGIEETALRPEPAPVRLLLDRQRELIQLRRFVGPQREALARLATLESPATGTGARSRIRECANRIARAVEEIDAAKDRLRVVQDHLDNAQAAAMAKNGFVLSVVAAIFLPLGFLTGLFGVNVAGLPGTDWPYAFAALSVGMVVIGVALYLVFRSLRWF